MSYGIGNSTNPCQLGFTLVELLVSIAIMMLIVPLAIEGVRTGLGTWNRLEQRADTMDRARTAQRVVRKQISEALPIHVNSADDEGTIIFRGSRTEVEFVANLPGHVSGGGVFFNKIQSAEINDEKVLLLSFWPLVGRADVEPSESDIERIVLSKGVEGIEISYFGTKSVRAQADWHERWDNDTHLPQLVRLRILRDQKRYPLWSELTIPIYASQRPG